MLDQAISVGYKWQTPAMLSASNWRSNQQRSSPAMDKPYFRSNYAEVKTQFEPPFDNCVCIPLTMGHHALVDSEDYNLICHVAWQARGKKTTTNFYAKNNIGNKGVRIHRLMHRIVMHSPEGMLIDHINRNGLDNRKKNLRVCTHSQNQYNRDRPRNKRFSQYRGVSKATSSKVLWKADISVNGKRKHLGIFSSEEDAARAYDLAAIEKHGDFACINFPKEDYNGKY